MLLDGGELSYLGAPQETARRYFRVNFEGPADKPHPSGGVWDVNVDVEDAWIQNAAGERVDAVEQGTPIELRVALRARRDLDAPIVGIHFADALGATIFGFNRPVQFAPGEPERVPDGARFRVGGAVENRLVPGRYHVHCYVARSRSQGDVALHRLRLLDFVVFGTDAAPGTVTVRADVEAVLEPDQSVEPVR
jgi:hypothetical protein